VIGNEHRGLGAEWLRAADVRLRIPMSEAMNSLNASTAAGIVLFEAVRQRGLRRTDRADPTARPPRAARAHRAE
jgi:tRNA G18 (ribose-2'-O)-methylase SpoU